MWSEYVEVRNGGYYVIGTRAITYYLANKDAVDAYLLETEKEWEQFADEHPIPTALREKLKRARRESLVKRS